MSPSSKPVTAYGAGGEAIKVWPIKDFDMTPYLRVLLQGRPPLLRPKP